MESLLNYLLFESKNKMAAMWHATMTTTDQLFSEL